MDKFIRFIVTIVGGIIITVILVIIGVILSVIMGIVAALLGIDVESRLFETIIHISVFVLIYLPYSLIVTYVLYNGLSKLKTKKYGLLAGVYTHGACCWVFNTLTLPYYLISLKYPPEYEETEAPPENYKKKFIIGWFIGLFFALLLISMNVISNEIVASYK